MFELFIKKVIELAVSIIISLSANQAKTTTTEKVKEKPVTTTTQVVKKEPVQKIVHLNNHLYVNEIDVEVVEVNPQSTYELQCIVNNPYKAVAYQYKNCLYIGDHSDQCFATLPYVKLKDKMYWKGKTYTCTYADDYAYLDVNGYIRLSNGTQLYDYETIALVTCKTNNTRYIRFFKED